ncbi:GIN domain-containing protein [Bacteroidota bacterium]
MRRSVLLVGIIISMAVLSSCDYGYYIVGEGPIVTETLELDEFSGINMLGAEDVEISYGETQEVEVRGHANIIARIKTSVYGEIWDMELERGNYRNYDLKYYITLPRINTIKNSGAARVVMYEFENEGDLEISINGAGDITLNRIENTENLYVSIDGFGHIECLDAMPSLKYLDIFITGSGEFNGFPVTTNTCVIEIDGAAKCEVSVEEELEVYIDGTGVVRYKGYPSINQNISGLGVVESRN